jgi:hypothetical protein
MSEYEKLIDYAAEQAKNCTWDPNKVFLQASYMCWDNRRRGSARWFTLEELKHRKFTLSRTQYSKVLMIEFTDVVLLPTSDREWGWLQLQSHRGLQPTVLN